MLPERAESSFIPPDNVHVVFHNPTSLHAPRFLIETMRVRIAVEKGELSREDGLDETNRYYRLEAINSLNGIPNEVLPEDIEQLHRLDQELADLRRSAK